MRRAKISAGGQVSIPAEIRHRWKSSRVTLEDRGDSLLIRPADDDPIGSLRGAFTDRSKPTSDELRRRARAEESASGARRG